MQTLRREYTSELTRVLRALPDEKVAAVVEFARRISRPVASADEIEQGALLLQQQSLSSIWDDPAEDLYEL